MGVIPCLKIFVPVTDRTHARGKRLRERLFLLYHLPTYPTQKKKKKKRKKGKREGKEKEKGRKNRENHILQYLYDQQK